MKPTEYRRNDASPTSRAFFYGWVIVAACCALLTIHAGIMYSYAVFFKPLAADFGWSRAATSGIYSVRMIMQGVFAIPVGWLADRFGPGRVMAFCSFMAGLGLLLTSRVSSLWQIYLTYGLVVGFGLSGTFTIGTATTARWFVKRRGLALGIVSAGMGLGTFIMLPIAERLVAALDWAGAIALFGVFALAIMVPSSLFLRRPPAQTVSRGPTQQGPHHVTETKAAGQAATEKGVSLKVAAASRGLWMLISAYFLVGFSIQVVMVHLVNYATDLGISALAAATAVSIIGIGGIAGRLVMGTASDRIGSNSALVTCLATLVVTLVWLVFARELWGFYIFAVFFGFAYGGEVPQLPVLVGQLFGLRSVATLVGAVMFGATTGGALGSWTGGKIFDATNSYQAAFVIAAIAIFTSTMITLMLRKQGKIAALHSR